MYKLVEEHDIKIIAYCIMNNHTHMLIETKDLKELSKYMQRLNMKYGRYYNKKYNRAGYVFRDRYKSEGIYSNEQLYSCIRYIYNNPVKAGMCKEAREYPYSNYKEYIYETEAEYKFMDIEDDAGEICQNVIEEFLVENGITFEELKQNRNILRKLIIFLKNEYDVSLRKIAERININRETVRKIYINLKE